MRQGEEGAALLSVLLLVAIMGALSAMAMERLNLATRLTGNGIALDQGRALAIGAEAVAAGHIGELTDRTTGVTTLAGGWKRTPIETQVSGGSMILRLDDAGNCFNLNSVAEGPPEGPFKARPIGISQFAALLLQLGIAPTDARVISASLADWIDSDSVPNPEGAEDEYYAGRPTPYRPGNTLLADVSELRAVKGMTPQIYDRLRQWVCALPVTDLSPINVNTLDLGQAPLLVMLMPGQLDLGRAESILAQRPRDGWTSIDQFWKMPSLSAMVPPMETQGQVQLRTRWFSADVTIRMGTTQVTETALLDGGKDPARIIQRRWGADE